MRGVDLAPSGAGHLNLDPHVALSRYFADAQIDGELFAGTTKTASVEDIFDPDEETGLVNGIGAVELVRAGQPWSDACRDDGR